MSAEKAGAAARERGAPGSESNSTGSVCGVCDGRVHVVCGISGWVGPSSPTPAD
jgi:hypothetical protein